MLSVSKMLSGQEELGDKLRYVGKVEVARPVVVWNSTRACNLRCRHCYASATPGPAPGEMTTEEARKFIQGLAEAKVPVLLFSGGEPLLRPDFFELVDYARSLGLRPVVSTNGTLIDRPVARKLKELGVGYVGISLDGLQEFNDRMRGVPGAFEAALRGIRACREVGQRVGLRFTITKDNYQEIPKIFDLVEEEGIDRVCFYHLVSVGRGKNLQQEDLEPEAKRRVLDLIIERALYFHRKGIKKEIFTVDNHADGVYLYLRLQEEKPGWAEKVYAWLRANGGNRSGIGIGAVDWWGNVYPDQFTHNHKLGNVREKRFGTIWFEDPPELLVMLRDRRRYLKGRCARCRWLDLCNGNFRARAEAVYGDFWAPDPGCYLTDAEIGL
ncbi:radical SAM/SPASM domain-containing protein [Ammonifex thiophilus]|uniref:Mycofactocin maturase MftC n=1 Tax=Ammonifex thiophilus TaxID=444093 RepID=A0A3D8P5M7_9THEO|nr:radical SAM protein [Ammonifex thiophilus]RDV84640.1 radical SAM protein [Ammonifex thiophilus]